MPDPPSGRPDRYEPLPGLLSLPGFLVRKLGRRGRVALALAGAALAAGLVVAAIVLVPKITETNREQRGGRAARARGRARASARAADRRAAPAPRRPPRRGLGRGAVLRRIEASVTRDARAREAAGGLPPPPARYSLCKPFADEPAGATISRLSCVAVTSEVPGQGGERAGVVGHPFRVLVDYGTGRYAWCKVSGRAGEGSFTRLTGVTLPRACGG